MIEAELKAVVRDPDAVAAALSARAASEQATYSDTYYDTPGHDLASSDRELRIRVIDREGFRRSRLTYKEAAVPGTTSKPEHETAIGDPAVFAALFAGLGLEVLVDLTKNCTNYSLDHAGYRMLATVVNVPELTETFIEVETQVPGAGDVPAALDAVRDLLGQLGIGQDDLDTRDYTDMVQKARAT